MKASITIVIVLMMMTVLAMAMEGNLERSGREPKPTDYNTLKRLINHWTQDVEGQPGQWALEIRDTPIFVLANEQHNRMRIMSPIGDATRLEEAAQRKMLEANFDRALDARYAIWQNKIWSVFLHPLAELSEQEFHRGVEQVIQLRKNYSTTYSSSALIFGVE